MADILLEEDKLTIWRPAEVPNQYRLIPETITEGEWDKAIQVYYTEFDCISSVLPFDQAVPIIQHQQTTLNPTQDYSILKDYPRIKGLWYRPDHIEKLGQVGNSKVGNIKFLLPFTRSDASEKMSLLENLNAYFVEVIDYGSDEKSASRILLSKNTYELPKYDVYKPGGPLYVVKNPETTDGPPETYFYLKLCSNYAGKVVRHKIEFMLENDPWPMCRISAVNFHPHQRPDLPSFLEDESEAFISTRYIDVTWKDSLAGLFAWSLRNHLAWLVQERLHENIRGLVDKEIRSVPFRDIFLGAYPPVCTHILNLLVDMTLSIAKCKSDRDILAMKRLMDRLHMCDLNCTLISVKNINFARVLPTYLLLLERIISCGSPSARYEVTTSILPWSVLAYHFESQRIEAYKKMVVFISQLEGMSRELELQGEDGLEKSYSSNSQTSLEDSIRYMNGAVM